MCSDWNANVNFSFIYWYAGEDGLKLASTGALNGGVLYYNENIQTVNQDFDYKPGFKVGLGLIWAHEWEFRAEYTWYRARNVTHSGSLSGTVLTGGIPTTTAANGTAVWVVDDWFLAGAGGQALSGSDVASVWRLNMDLIDGVAGRPFYQGRRVIVSPYGGLRAALIRQSMTVSLTEATGLFTGAPFAVGTIPSQPIKSHNFSNSWAIGPRFGANCEFLLPLGMRLEGDLAASILYTKYTSLKHREDNASTSFNTGPFTSQIDDYSSVRPEADCSLGFGWGTYFGCRDYHIDFSAKYEFMIFWAQNMIRSALDDTLTGTGPSPSNLYLHGLTLNGRFDF